MAARKILIVEDEVIIAETIRRDLISLGYQVVDSVLSGEDAVQSAWQYRPDLVLMDIVLQGEMDGLVAAEKIQKELNIPVVFLTANSDRNTAEKVKNTRPYGYLLKPFQQSELYTAIETGLYKHQTETALRESERWLTATLDHINDGVVSVDADGKVVLWNPVAELLTGFRRRAALGKSLSSLIHLTCATSGKFFPLSAAGINDLSRELKGEGLLYVGKRDGIPVEASLTPIRISSSLKGAVLVLRDLRERIDAARSLQESQKANLELQQRILEVQKMDSIGRLAGGIAHDFNNILTSIYGYAAFMRSTIATNHEFYSFLHSIENSAQRASDLTSKLLGFARKGGYEIRDIAVDQVIEDVLRVIEPQLPPNIHLEVDLDKTHPVVSADSPQLQRVLVYLCDNAREAMPAGGTLRIETRIVELES
nr:response regulator [Calditrichia bacterium]